jgi:hypothetical protein
MGNNLLNLLYFTQGSTYYLLNQGDQTIVELDFDNASFGYDSGYMVGSDYGRYLVRDFTPKTYFKVYALTLEETVYRPNHMWLQLDIHRCVMADGSVHEGLKLNSVERWGGYKPEAQFVELPMEKVVQNSQ